MAENSEETIPVEETHAAEEAQQPLTEEPVKKGRGRPKIGRAHV